MNQEIICIVCPLGCRMDVELEGSDVRSVKGNQCKKGIKHAQKEVTFPGRILTTTVLTDIPGVPLLPVRSSMEVPKDQLMSCMAEIAKQKVTGSIKLGEPVINDILGLGADIVACRTVPYYFES